MCSIALAETCIWPHRYTQRWTSSAASCSKIATGSSRRLKQFGLSPNVAVAAHWTRRSPLMLSLYPALSEVAMTVRYRPGNAYSWLGIYSIIDVDRSSVRYNIMGITTVCIVSLRNLVSDFEPVQLPSAVSFLNIAVILNQEVALCWFGASAIGTFSCQGDVCFHPLFCTSNNVMKQLLELDPPGTQKKPVSAFLPRDAGATKSSFDSDSCPDSVGETATECDPRIHTDVRVYKSNSPVRCVRRGSILLY